MSSRHDLKEKTIVNHGISTISISCKSNRNDTTENNKEVCPIIHHYQLRVGSNVLGLSPTFSFFCCPNYFRKWENHLMNLILPYWSMGAVESENKNKSRNFKTNLQNLQIHTETIIIMWTPLQADTKN